MCAHVRVRAADTFQSYRTLILVVMAVTAEQIEAQLAPLMEDVARAQQASPHDDLSGGLSDIEMRKIRLRCEAAVERLAPANSVYMRDAHNLGKMWDGKRILTLIGILQALQADYAAGYLRTVEELLHADVFGDFLGMADELLDKGYKDASAVIAGTVLEEHLRKLAASHNIAVENEEGKARKAESLNADLAKEEATPSSNRSR
jgi:hypothetical protein